MKKKIKASQLRKIIRESINEKAVSKSQQRFFGMVDAYKKGDLSGKDVSKSVKDAAKGMSMKQVKDFSKTKHKGLPNHINEEQLRKIIREILEEVYSTQGGMSDDYDIQAFERFVHNYPDLPECGWLGRADGELQTNNQVLMMYRDLSYKIYNALPSESTKESYRWLCNAYSFLKRGDKEKANYSYTQSIRLLQDALSKQRLNEATLF